MGGQAFTAAGNRVASLNATNSGSGDIVLDDASAFLVINGISQSGGGNVTLNNTGSIVLTGNIAAGAGLVSLTSTGGPLVDGGANDIITAGTLTGSAATGVTLSDPNLVGTLGPFTNTTSGNVDIGNGQSLATSGTISNAAATGTLTLSVSNGGALTIGGGGVTTSNGFITLSADNTMTLNSAVNAGTASASLMPFSAMAWRSMSGICPGWPAGSDPGQPQPGHGGGVAHRLTSGKIR